MAVLHRTAALPPGHAAAFGAVCLRHGEVGEVTRASGRSESSHLGSLGAVIGNPKTVAMTLINATTFEHVGDIGVSGTNSLFCLKLRPGRYAISDVTITESSIAALDLLLGTTGAEMSTESYRVYGEFEVGPDLAPTYIGDLNIGLDSYYRVVGAVLQDDFATTSTRFHAEYPNVSGTHSKSLLVLETKR